MLQMNPHRLHSPSFLFMITSFMFKIGISSSLSHNDIDDQRLNPCSYQFGCGSIPNLSYPFWAPNHGPDCGHPGFKLECQDKFKPPVIVINWNEYGLLSVDQEKKIMRVVRMDIWEDACPHKLLNTSFDGTPFDYAPNYQNLTFLYKCSPRVFPRGVKGLKCSINDEEGFYKEDIVTLNVQIQSCEAMVAVPVLLGSHKDRRLRIQEVLKKGFDLKYKYDDGQACSSCDEANPGKNKLSLILAIVIPVAGILLICVLSFLCRKKWKSASSNLVSRNISSVPSSKSDLERGSVYFGVLPIFSYSELEEATNNFDSNEELGDGGFGTVYYGKLRDGREVAVKRLYENNCKRVEQFMNEVQILAVLRHKNLVSLYGCTSRHSRELLLVYEFIPNGTVADHLHGDQPNPGSLTWPIRMSIAIETATALAYLHASDIIHRDVKTNNILLDNNFCVKVADFGLSRLFPMDVTHVSTAPQGTPGYLDPDYHQCYQLTDKSDVYSFGVVLIELISSLPAVDISRHRHEINLADLAISKIQNCAFSELIDSSLGFERDLVVRRMTTRVAELAFRCLQLDKDMRPSMDEVCDILKGIESENYEVEETEEVENIDVGVLEKSTKSLPSLDSDDVGLLKNMQLPHSPNTVTEKWVSRSTTPNTVLEKSTRSLPSPDFDDVGLLKNMQLPHSPNTVTEKWVSRSTTPNPSA